MDSNFMTAITIPIPQTLYDRIGLRAEEIGVTTEHLAGIWLWQIEREKRINGDERSTTRQTTGRDDWDLPASEDD